MVLEVYLSRVIERNTDADGVKIRDSQGWYHSTREEIPCYYQHPIGRSKCEETGEGLRAQALDPSGTIMSARDECSPQSGNVVRHVRYYWAFGQNVDVFIPTRTYSLCGTGSQV